MAEAGTAHPFAVFRRLRACQPDDGSEWKPEGDNLMLSAVLLTMALGVNAPAQAVPPAVEVAPSAAPQPAVAAEVPQQRRPRPKARIWGGNGGGANRAGEIKRAPRPPTIPPDEQPKAPQAPREQARSDQRRNDQPKAEQALPVNPNDSVEELPMVDEAEEQKRRASERVQKLRNLSFNINGADSNNEFETVPAYIRRNLELYNTVNNVENFYSNYTVKADDQNNAQISTINTFLEGKKPD